ncbi:hypothetical protein BV22DRAFT_1089642 [Leucogyrophana mollusca]|uniref:Uncharacterized protein n=1 Tax=Leucogyrophana mollusca TaxID=85980 RepID=A0ACB8BHW5_9AGAM|nr:hypothetical protein BV22DRAFT_1089642 [Leucogyrophana mollusca]
MSSSELTVDDFWVSRVTSFNACVALVLVLWDWVVNFDDEVSLIWGTQVALSSSNQNAPTDTVISSSPRRTPRQALYKSSYLFLRYGGIGFQIFNFLFALRMETHVPIDITHCKLWLVYQGIVCQTMTTLVEGLLMLRVYLLWKRSLKIAGALFLLIVLEVSCMVFGAKMVIPDQGLNQLCFFKKPPIGAIFFVTASIVTQTTIVALLLIKRRAGRHKRWGKAPLYLLVMRDATLIFLVIFSLLLMGLIYAIVGNGYGDIIFYWTLSVLSICGCKTITNTQRMPDTMAGSSRTTDTIHVSTDIWIEEDDSPSELPTVMPPLNVDDAVTTP